GIETKGGLNSIIIPRNTRYPVKCTTPYVTVADNQTRMRIRVCQGERPIAEDAK
ncbi:Chaperone protein DnaK-like protein, partial [Leptotrombidium deliense]